MYYPYASERYNTLYASLEKRQEGGVQTGWGEASEEGQSRKTLGAMEHNVFSPVTGDFFSSTY